MKNMQCAPRTGEQILLLIPYEQIEWDIGWWEDYDSCWHYNSEVGSSPLQPLAWLPLPPLPEECAKRSYGAQVLGLAFGGDKASLLKHHAADMIDLLIDSGPQDAERDAMADKFATIAVDRIVDAVAWGARALERDG